MKVTSTKRFLMSGIASIMILGFVSTSSAQDQKQLQSGFGIRFIPSMIVPLGQNSELFSFGGGAIVLPYYRIGRIPFLTFDADLAIGLLPIRPNPAATQEYSSIVSIAHIGAGVTGLMPLGNRLKIFARGSAGYSGATVGLVPQFGGTYYFSGAAGVDLAFSDAFSMGLEGRYVFYADFVQIVSASLGLEFSPRRPSSKGVLTPRTPVTPLQKVDKSGKPLTGAGLVVRQITTEGVFPTLLKYYDTNPICRVTLFNDSESLIEDIQISLEMQTYMDKPKLSAPVTLLDPGKEVTIDLLALFNEQVLQITEGTKVASTLRIKHLRDGVSKLQEVTFTLQIYDRNALAWNDDRKVASFVTAKDDEVLLFAKNAAAATRPLTKKAISSNLQLAMMLFQALRLNGVTYIVDPSSSYVALSKDSSAIDYVQFPRQTLQFRSGDCDDLSVLYCALLESVGVRTAFLTVPGHIFTAFELDLGSQEAKSYISALGLIERDDGSTWVPVEITLLDSGFIKACAAGGSEWRENQESQKARFFSTQDSWKSFEPVAFSFKSTSIKPLDERALRSSFESELSKYISIEISAMESKLIEAIKENQQDKATRNRLGILYARYDLRDKAIKIFEDLAREGFAPAHVNLGNLQILAGDYDKALSYFEKAAAIKPDSHAAQLGLARVFYELQQYDRAREHYGRLQMLQPAVAERFSYIETRSDATRAASSEVQAIVWEEEK
ncbi:MAG: tetratricopeptide repeat protein [Spirochaetes bacterium]|nr:tetratricopeptide repeat protein [Spirochaetota bacterium]